MQRLLIANWKHHPARLFEALELASGLAAIEVPEGSAVVVCPPYPYLAPVRVASPGLLLGSQDISAQEPGAFTGEVGAAILADLGVAYAIVGHSERRALGETDAQVASKARAALAAGIFPVICVGESREIQSAGDEAVRAFLAGQLAAVPDDSDAIVAYEPLWAIGSGLAATATDASATARWIASELGDRVASLTVLYGGSVTPANAAAFLAEPDLGGLLVGGASLDAASFSAIVTAA